MMADGDVSYASVVFKANKQPRQEAQKEEETVYDEVKVANQTAEQNPDVNGFLPDKKADSRRRCYQQLACGLGALCVVLLLGIIAIVIYKSNITSLTAEKRNLTTNINKLNAQNQELEMDKNNLAEQIQNWKKFNTSRAQWSIDEYCPKNEGKRECEPCQKGWRTAESNCYAINDPTNYEYLRTWEEAQEDCSGKNSDLVVVATEAEKNYVNANSWPYGNLIQYWIGLRAVDGKWKWIDGSDLTENSWMSGQSAVDGYCVVSIQNKGWKSVNCTQKNRWICQKKALSV
ncbi:CD209 antigen-like protein E isoform X2 [Amphiprion ocellaris]|uniref:CD209 antigen-like protein E isoform X2 n=1 Tax=Amphiprion ocellaris TaxID=80972 RepID=UPI002410BA6D|nr:CD209 antigen-like protein E isoform X2 [Amphiprion ocellaris]